jgi:leucyl/phenylalanyl-tRNA--protein transferase|tara:strand:- start:421 stop:1125 length:705 start_codon:yes stop_codon:yes gene_type:complete
MPVIWLEPDVIEFPPVEEALDDPEGLLAAGGELSLPWLVHAYRQGIFPWYEAGQPILWWSPDPRMVLFPEELRVSRSLAKTLRKEHFHVTFDTSFAAVIQACAESRAGVAGTWITDDMKNAYGKLFDAGIAHSVEVWADDQLVGGLYGIALGKVFFGESMFSKTSNASKAGFVYLVKQLGIWGFELVDCQVSSEHLASLGAVEISRKEFCTYLTRCIDANTTCQQWQFQSDLMT